MGPLVQLFGTQHVRLIRLTASVLGDGLSEETRTILSSMPSVAPFLDEESDNDAKGIVANEGKFASLDRDVAYRMSAYIDRDRRADLDQELVAALGRVGIPPNGSLPADHAATLLEYLARVVELGEPAEDLLPPAIGYMRYWIQPLCCVVERFDSRVAHLLVSSVEQLLPGTGIGEIFPVEMTRADDILSEDGREVTPRRLAAHLASPDQCGMFIGRDVLVEIGRQQSVPTGFGSRRDMAAILLEGGVRYGTIGGVLDAVTLHLESEVASYSDFSSGSQRWLSQLETTLAIVAGAKVQFDSSGDLAS